MADGDVPLDQPLHNLERPLPGFRRDGRRGVRAGLPVGGWQNEQPERVDDAADRLRESLQNIGDRLHRTHLTLTERYAEGHMRLHVRILLELPDCETATAEFCARFERSSKGHSLAGHLEASTSTETNLEEDRPNASGYQQRKAVLVDIGQLAEKPERMFRGVIGSLVRLRFLNDCECARVDTPFDPDRAYFRVLGLGEPCVVDGEGGVFAWRAAIGGYQLPGQLVESRSKVLDAIANDRRNASRQRHNGFQSGPEVDESRGGLDWIGLGFHDDEFTLSLSPPPFLILHGVEVLAGPGEFAVNATQIAEHGASWDDRA